VRARVTEIRSRINVERLTSHPSAALELNGIGEVVIETQRPLIADLYRDHRSTGSFILIDASDNATAGAGMIRAFEDASRSILPGGVVAVGNRSLLAVDLEARLLDRGALVLRTRFSDRDALLPLVLAGAVVISESAGDEDVTIISGDGELLPAPSSDDPEAILRHLKTISGRDANDLAH
jgi:hypothetical protein